MNRNPNRCKKKEKAMETKSARKKAKKNSTDKIVYQLEGIARNIYTAIRKRPTKGWTVTEMYEKLSEDGYDTNYKSVSARLSELKSNGFIGTGGKRNCSWTGYTTSFYVPV